MLWYRIENLTNILGFCVYDAKSYLGKLEGLNLPCLVRKHSTEPCNYMLVAYPPMKTLSA